tara:strand:- start:880 stop:1296 length:417 start_codon:yes stop_codon:yes gene_type:complete
MATTTAQITITSADIADNAMSITSTATLTNAATDTGMTETTGLARKTADFSSNTILLDSDHAQSGITADKASKVFIKNTNARGDGSKYVNILIQAVEIGRLYGGDWMFIPWAGGSGNDIEVTASDSTSTTLEYMSIFE